MRQLVPMAMLAALTASGCAAKQLTPPSPTLCAGICSEGSGYAPVARLFVSTRRVGDSLDVVVDSGVVGVPSLQASAPGPVLMARLSFRAFVGIQVRAEQMGADSAERVASVRRGHAWRFGAESSKQPLADTLRYGQVLTMAPTRFDLALPKALPNNAWLGFEITGDAIDPRAESPRRGTMVNGVRVYVCDPRTLGGGIDSTRARSLAERYVETC